MPEEVNIQKKVRRMFKECFKTKNNIEELIIIGHLQDFYKYSEEKEKEIKKKRKILEK